MPMANTKVGSMDEARRLQLMQEGVSVLRIIAQSLQQIQATLQRMEMKAHR